MQTAEAFHVIVLGAGAAGLMAAIEAGKRGRRVLVLDHADRAGKKILISGGGRCNFTNMACTAENFLSANPHFAKSALARYTPADFVAMVERHRIRYHEKAPGQLFCDGSAREIVSMLEEECDQAHVRIRTETEVSTLARLPGGFQLDVEGGSSHRAESLIVATGGLSIPRMGATGLGYRIAQQFGHTLVDCRPGLVPLTFHPHQRDLWCDLAGVSFEVAISAGKNRTFREKLLVTHKGLSGPAILQISSFWQPGSELSVDLAPGREVLASVHETTRRDAATITQALKTSLPTRIAERWAALHGPGDLSNAGIARHEAAIHAWNIAPAGTEGYAKAEVTVGGVDTAQLNARTLESRLVPGLFFIGEVVDVTGWLGGYNFQWAWASGVAAGAAA